MAKKASKKVVKKVLRMPGLSKMGLGLLEKQLENLDKKEKKGRKSDEGYREALEAEISKRKKLKSERSK